MLPKYRFLPHPLVMASHPKPSPSVRGATTSALEAAIRTGDLDFIYQMFANNARDLATTGQGKQLIRLAKYAGDESLNGKALQKIFTLMGHLVELEFSVVQVLILELETEKTKTDIEDFIDKLIAYAQAHINYSLGNLVQARDQVNYALTAPVHTSDLEGLDKPALIRINAMLSYIYSDASAIQKAQSEVEKLIQDFGGANISYHLIAIKAINYYEQGHFIKANEFAKMGIAAAEANGFVGLRGSLDCKYILCRTLFEFAKLDQALTELDELKIAAKRDKFTLFYVLAETFAIRILTAQSQIPVALERLAKLHEEIDINSNKNDLIWLIDVTELYIRFILKDTVRANLLITRCPDLPYVRQVKIALDESSKKADPKRLEIMNLPENNYREQIYKYIYLAEFKAEVGHNPKSWMKKALAIGELVGSREFFIKQTDYCINLIIEIAKENSSVYLDGLVKECVQRLRQRNELNKPNTEGLSMRELEVLQHLASGKSVDAIGKTLHVSKNTMKTHLRNIYRKLEVSSRADAVGQGEKLLLI